MTEPELVKIETEDGVMDARVFRPSAKGMAGNGPWPAVMFYLDAFGLREALNRLAQPIADAGFLVLQPNLFWRVGEFPKFDPKTVFSPDSPDRPRLMAILQGTTVDGMMKDSAACLGFLERRPDVKGSSVRAVGYCFGGFTALTLAAHFPDRVVAAASIHGSRLATDHPESPHKLATRMRAEIYIAVAGRDQGHTPETTRRLEQAFEAAGIRHTIETYPRVMHGFSADDGAAYDREASQKQLEQTIALFDRHRS